MADFDLHTTDVPIGLSVIEASAGTGKTWTIAHLLPRLLVDGAVSGIGDVLLVTFTEDAARELGEQTRRQLATLVGHADAGTQPAENQTGIQLLLDRLDALPAPERRRPCCVCVWRWMKATSSRCRPFMPSASKYSGPRDSCAACPPGSRSYRTPAT